LSAAQGPSCFEFVAWLRFLATQERKVPRDARTKISVPKVLKR
jgi:hypothetical protein